jgi:predicted RNase H-like HicB family nuclease
LKPLIIQPKPEKGYFYKEVYMIDRMLYKVNIKKTDEGYSVWVPGLPGCWSQGKTEDEALENIKDAIESYLETVEKLNKDVESRYVEVMTSHA